MRRLFLLLSGLSAACAHPAIRDLSVPPPQAPRPSRGCVLSVGSVTDERPTIEREGGKRKLKAIVALMRKLAAALWHVARGATYDPTKLIDARRLGLAN